MRRGQLVVPIGIALLLVPATSGGQTLELVGRIPGPATGVYVHEGRAYLSDGPTLRIVDLGEPAAPRILGSHTFPLDVRGVRVSESVAYVAIDFVGLGMLDVSDPTAPRALGTVETPGQALGVGVSGTMAAVINRISGLELIDVSDPSAPASEGAYFTEGYAIDVDASGGFAYVVDTPGGLSIVDLGRAGEVEAEATLGTAEPSASLAVTTLRTADGVDRTIAGVMGVNSLLELFDVTDPTAPVSVGTYRNPTRERPTADGYAGAAATVGLIRVRLQGSLAFLTDAYPPFALQVVDISDPANPALVTAWEPSGSPYDIAVSGSLVLVALRSEDDEPGVVILRLRE
jgi:hypothetical protein